jgi:DnaJ family protein C protein 2
LILFKKRITKIKLNFFIEALKTYPATLADRWEKISECIPTRSKKDCILRYKELVELIQAKKKAQQKVVTK